MSDQHGISIDTWMKHRDDFDALVEIVDALCDTLLSEPYLANRAATLKSIAERARNLRQRGLGET